MKNQKNLVQYLVLKFPNSNFDLSDMDSLIQFDNNLYIEPILNSSNDIIIYFRLILS